MPRVRPPSPAPMLVQLSWQSTPLVRVRSCVQAALQAPFGPVTQRQSGGLRIRSSVVQPHPGPPFNICVCGETGKRVALRALWWQHFIGSSPITRTKMSLWRNRQTRTAQTRFVMGSTPIRLTILQRGRIVAQCGGLLIRCSLLEPRVQIPPLLPFIGVWCNGSITLSKSADWGSNPCTPASANSFMAKSICKSIVEQDVGLKVSSI